MKIYHNSRNKEYRDPFGAVHAWSSVRLAVDISDCDVRGVELELWRDGEARQYLPMMQEFNRVEGCRYSIAFMVPEQGGLMWYRFLIHYRQDGETRSIYYGNNHTGTGGEGRSGFEGDVSPYQITVYKPSEVPSWYKDGIVYQIFPDRFARDEDWRERVEKANDAINQRRSDMRRVIQDDWEKTAYYGRDETGRVIEWPMLGGSLRGIEEKLDYLKSLGVTSIYLNPIFEASSNHRYDTGNYMKTDPALGTDEDFASLAASARERGIRLILDGVFSHTGSDSIYFDKYGSYPKDEDSSVSAEGHGGAWLDPESPYHSWFLFDQNQRYGYKTWWGVEDLPEVDENVKSYRKFILGPDGVVDHWMKMGASGWRLDVADELPDSFIEETRRRVRTSDPEGLLIGEVWEDASNKISYNVRRRYLLGDELDGCMNYPLRDILLDYINYTIPSGFAADKLLNLYENYPFENFYANLNLIGSHDRERIITAMACDKDYESAVKKVIMLSTLQYAFPGVPCIYYGDEAGLTGGADPANRSGFPWGRENLDLGFHYRMLGLLYDEHPALKGGSLEILSGKHGISDDIFAFTRKGRDAAGTEETLLVMANRSYGKSSADLSGIESLRGGYAVELLESEEMELDENGSLGTVVMDKLSVMIISIRATGVKYEDLGRDCGVICHISSLCKPVLGTPAKEFVDYLVSAGFGIWQVLPLNPAGAGGSPYSSYAAFAGDPRFINRDELPESSGDLFTDSRFESFIKTNAYWLYDYIVYTLLKEANDQKPWYEWPQELRSADAVHVKGVPADVILRDILRGGPAYETLMRRNSFLGSLSDEQVARAKELAAEQFCFFVQWNDLRAYANSKGVRIMGDLPIFMAADSADVWANRHIFCLDGDGRQRVHAGVPPDKFSDFGQDWGNPLYDWDELRRTGYDWWFKRMRQCAERYDILRIDHFRGFSEYFAIPEGRIPKYGCWQHGPAMAFVTAVRNMIRNEGYSLRLLAEDLGYLDSGVKNLLKFTGMPGMDIWQFTAEEMMKLSSGEPEKAARRVYYTGTHDNNTLIGYLSGLYPGKKTEADADADAYADEDPDAAADTEADAYAEAEAFAVTAPEEYTGEPEAAACSDPNADAGSFEEAYDQADPEEAADTDADADAGSEEETEAAYALRLEEKALDIIEKIYMSKASLAILQLQDVFMLGEDARMNVPGVPEGNWTWKIPGSSIEEAFPDAAARAAYFRELAIKSGRR